MNELKDMYDFKMFININGEDLLTFRAFVVDKDTYYFKEVPRFGIHENDKKIFLAMLNGTLEIDEYEIVNREAIISKRKPKESNDIVSLLKEASLFFEKYLDIKATHTLIELSPMLDFRFEGHALNIGQGLELKTATKIHHATDEIMEAIANNADFEGITQALPRVGSTIIPYLSETIDNGALGVLKKVIYDINNKSVNQMDSFIESKYINLYKTLVKKFKSLKNVPDLELFQVIIDKNVYEINDFSLIDDAQKQLIDEKVEELKVFVHRRAYALVGNSSIYSALVIHNDITENLHIKADNESFEHIRKVLSDNEEKNVLISGYRTGERTIVLDSVKRIIV